jgi:hypothetical protein
MGVGQIEFVKLVFQNLPLANQRCQVVPEVAALTPLFKSCCSSFED